MIADVCEVTYDKKDVISVFRLGKNKMMIQEFDLLSLNFQTYQ